MSRVIETPLHSFFTEISAHKRAEPIIMTLASHGHFDSPDRAMDMSRCLLREGIPSPFLGWTSAVLTAQASAMRGQLKAFSFLKIPDESSCLVLEAVSVLTFDTRTGVSLTQDNTRHSVYDLEREINAQLKNRRLYAERYRQAFQLAGMMKRFSSF